jgi:hypothetical protein
VQAILHFLDVRQGRGKVELSPEFARDAWKNDFLIADALWADLARLTGPGDDFSSGLNRARSRLADAVTNPIQRCADDDNHQLLQAGMLFKTAGLHGQGPGRTDAGPLPAADTDLPLAIIADQMGVIGAIGVCLALYVLVILGCSAALRARSSVGTMLAFTAAAHLAAYAIINIYGTLGLPTSGVPLPFVSRGGTALIAALGMVAMITAIAADVGGHDRTDIRERIRFLASRTRRWLPAAPIALLLFFGPVYLTAAWAFVRPLPVLEPMIGEPRNHEPAWFPRRNAVVAKAQRPRIVVPLRGTEGTMVIALRDDEGARTYPTPVQGSLLDPGTLARSLITVLGTSSGSPVQGVEALYQGQTFGGCPAEPCDVVLTIDPVMQSALRRAFLVTAQRATGSNDPRGAAIVVEADTGAIRALVSFPEPEIADIYDQEKIADWMWRERVRGLGSDAQPDDDRAPYLNRALNGAYAPGSVAKLITLGCAVENGVVTRDTRIEDSGQEFRLPGATVRKHGNIPWWLEGEHSWTFTEGFSWSLNGWFARAANAVGATKYASCVRNLGVATEGASTRLPIDVPGSAAQLNAGNLIDTQRLVDAGFGQGEWLVNPLHLALITASVANDGIMPSAHVVAGLRGSDGSFQTSPFIARTAGRRVWSVSTARLLQEALVASTQAPSPPQRIGGWAGLTVPSLRTVIGEQQLTGAKTGTAETKIGKPHSWSTALAPASSGHALAIAVVIEHGGEGATGALNVIEESLREGSASELLNSPRR